MADINPLTLQKRLQKAINQTPKLVQESLERSNLEEINRENLLKGQDNEGNNMPSYRDPEYANFKTTINPKNRGFWDLRVTGGFYKNIFAKVEKKKVQFFQKLSNEKTRFIFKKQPKELVIGMQDKQFEKVQIDNKPELFKRLNAIISQGK